MVPGDYVEVDAVLLGDPVQLVFEGRARPVAGPRSYPDVADAEHLGDAEFAGALEDLLRPAKLAVPSGPSSCRCASAMSPISAYTSSSRWKVGVAARASKKIGSPGPGSLPNRSTNASRCASSVDRHSPEASGVRWIVRPVAVRVCWTKPGSPWRAIIIRACSSRARARAARARLVFWLLFLAIGAPPTLDADGCSEVQRIGSS